MLRKGLIWAFIFTIGYTFLSGLGGCAQVGMPTGGDRDSTAPTLVSSTPENGTVNFETNRITLTFDEYVEVKESNKVLISPYQNKTPQINWNLRNVTIRLRDTLRPNTTYSINFGNSLVDVNESNPFQNFTYVFSTGSHIDSLSVKGKVLMAETGQADSTLQVYLYNEHLDDSSVLKHRPQYAAPVTGEGDFEVKYLPPGTYKAYVLKDNDGRRTYNNASEAFGFLAGDSSFVLSDSVSLPIIYAFEQTKFEKPAVGGGNTQKEKEKKLNFTTDVAGKAQDISQPLKIVFNQKVGSVDTNLLRIADTLNNNIDYNFSWDSTQTIASLMPQWSPGTDYDLIIPVEAAKDTLGANLFAGDTIRFRTMATADYGRVTLRFQGLSYDEIPVLVVTQNNAIMYQGKIENNVWINNQFSPGDYELKILFDRNDDGKWTTGNYSMLLQPERIITLPQKLNVRADWDNERDIILTNE